MTREGGGPPVVEGRTQGSAGCKVGMSSTTLIVVGRVRQYTSVLITVSPLVGSYLPRTSKYNVGSYSIYIKMKGGRRPRGKAILIYQNERGKETNQGQGTANQF